MPRGSHLVNNPAEILQIIRSLINRNIKKKNMTLISCIDQKLKKQTLFDDNKIKQLIRAIFSPRQKTLVGYLKWIFEFIFYKLKYKSISLYKLIFWNK